MDGVPDRQPNGARASGPAKPEESGVREKTTKVLLIAQIGRHASHSQTQRPGKTLETEGINGFKLTSKPVRKMAPPISSNVRFFPGLEGSSEPERPPREQPPRQEPPVDGTSAAVSRRTPEEGVFLGNKGLQDFWKSGKINQSLSPVSHTEPRSASPYQSRPLQPILQKTPVVNGQNHNAENRPEKSTCQVSGSEKSTNERPSTDRLPLTADGPKTIFFSPPEPQTQPVTWVNGAPTLKLPVQPNGMSRQEPMRQMPFNIHTKKQQQKQQQRRPGQSKALDLGLLDSFIYNQEGAAKPPPGLVLRPAVSLAKRPETLVKEDEPLYADIDPRIHWPQPRSEAWHEAKQNEIKERGGRKAQFGKAALRLRQQRLEEGEPDSFEETLPDKIVENPAWVRMLKRLHNIEDEIAAVGGANGVGKRGRRRAGDVGL